MNFKIEELTANKDLTVLMPSLNEEKAIRKIIQETRDALDNSDINYCMIISDNGSSDKTLEICKEEKILVNYCAEKGYGANLSNAIKKINSKLEKAKLKAVASKEISPFWLLIFSFLFLKNEKREQERQS